MSVKFSTAEIELQDLTAKPRVNVPCEARIRVTEQSLKEEKQLLVFEVKAATVNDQIGRVHPEFLNLPSGSNADTDRQLCRRLSSFALAFGLMSPDKLSTGEVEIDFADAVGKEVIVEFVKRPQGVQVSFLGVWALDDSAAPTVN